jgi:type II secretory pathway pseudopilin PulG
MRSSNKSRSRNKNNRNRNHNHNQSHGGNVVNRVFDSSGPDGKVRGTPQQIIDKYQSLARDAQLAGDRVAAENFLQHAEHYTRLLVTAQREMNERREAQEAQRAAQEAQRAAQEAQRQAQQAAQAEKNPAPKPAPAPVATGAADDQPEIPVMGTADLFPGQEDAGNLVQTPESRPAKPKSNKPRTRRKPAPKPAAQEGEASKPSPENVVE